jgi:CheY-like chemotaxis protein
MAKVLVVDDEQVMRRVLRKYLDKGGHDVLEAVDGIDALEKLENGGVALALIDLMMPRMDGFELLRLAPTRFPDTAVIVISGIEKELDRAKEEFTMVAALGKPFEIDELDRAIRDALTGENLDD